jgi:hypothetical protein
MPTPTTTTWAQLTQTNYDKTWQVLRRTDREGLLVMLVRALKSVPASELESIFGQYAHPREIGDIEPQAPRPLLKAVGDFTDAALRGEFYVGSSRGVPNSFEVGLDFEAQLELLFDRCIAEASTGDPAEVCAAYERLLDLLREIDKFEKDIVFFADEGGVCQLGINWQRVLSGYVFSLVKTTSGTEFRRVALAVIEEFADEDQGELTKLVASLIAPTR